MLQHGPLTVNNRCDTDQKWNLNYSFRHTIALVTVINCTIRWHQTTRQFHSTWQRGFSWLMLLSVERPSPTNTAKSQRHSTIFKWTYDHRHVMAISWQDIWLQLTYIAFQTGNNKCCKVKYTISSNNFTRQRKHYYLGFAKLSSEFTGVTWTAQDKDQHLAAVSIDHMFEIPPPAGQTPCSTKPWGLRITFLSTKSFEYLFIWPGQPLIRTAFQLGSCG